jgi:hypothetical protein
MKKIEDTLDILYAIKHELPYYDYHTQELDLVDYIDTIHNFCDECLDYFDFSHYWFADFLAGHCRTEDCDQLEIEPFRVLWDPTSHSRLRGGIQV